MSLEQHFAPRLANGISWPNAAVFVAQSRQLMFCPIAKCACTSLKRLMVELSDVPHKQEILAGDVHTATGKYRTGVLLIDQEIDHARQLIHDPAYFRFAVLRDPFDRLLSAYREKFLVNRLIPRNHFHTRKLIAAVQGEDPPDYDLGISFAEFLRYVTSQDPQTLDTHWRPQADYLRGMHYDRLYPFNDLDRLARELERRVGELPVIEHRNRSAAIQSRELAGVTRLRAGEIESPAEIAKLSFAEDLELVAMVENYFHEDRQLYRDAVATATFALA